MIRKLYLTLNSGFMRWVPLCGPPGFHPVEESEVLEFNLVVPDPLVLSEVCIAKFQKLRTYYRKEKKKLLTFKSGIEAEDIVAKWEHFTRLQFLDDTINTVESTSDLDYVELEINAQYTPLNDSMYAEAEELIEPTVEPPSPPSIPCSGSESTGSQLLLQGTRISASTPQAKKRKLKGGDEYFYESMQKCLEDMDKKNSQ
ncbi:hypothetical protein TNCV_4574901 [Trichonephila clavipes]|nr:hypothetical protein TNCV_4574901 [Trichonephila clavipes]